MVIISNIIFIGEKMLLSQLTKNDTATITKLNCNNELRQRFYSFGLIEGAEIKVGEISIAKKTIELINDNTSIAIRIEEAQQIEVNKG